MYYSLKYGEHYADGIDFFNEDWDNLLILDACRFDVFESTSTLPGELSKRYSMASSTREWLSSNCDGHEYHDTVYVTANPQFCRNIDGNDISFHDVWNVWLDEGWDENTNTVLPETLAEKSKEAVEQYPNKRIVIHFLQPHYPFIGQFGREAFENADLRGFYQDIFEGRHSYSIADVRRAYRENLECVLSVVDGLLGELDGKTVVTADHGEALGERARPIPIREFGHPMGVYMEELVCIPWLKYSNGARREVVEEVPQSGERTEGTDELVNNRLRHLGYV